MCSWVNCFARVVVDDKNIPAFSCYRKYNISFTKFEKAQRDYNGSFDPYIRPYQNQTFLSHKLKSSK
jgi:hypothetical protein